MAIFVKRALRYSAFLYPSRDGSQESRINIYTEDGYRLYISFQGEEAAPGSNSYNASTKTGVAMESASRYANYLDLLRNESPVWVTFNEEASFFVVYAAEEPVGEHES